MKLMIWLLFSAFCFSCGIILYQRGVLDQQRTELQAESAANNMLFNFVMTHNCTRK